jgi:hypothetical protein
MTLLRERPGTVRAAPWSSAQWCAYYEANKDNLLALPWGRGPAWSEAERDALAASLQDFQLGEKSEGHHLLRRGADHAEQAGDSEYVEALRLFIAEEQRHARDLGRFLTLAGVPLLERSKLDSVFRWLRRLTGLELAISVLLTAETAGKVYYTALCRATGSVLLKRLCVQLLRDEVQHMRFHAERLAMVRRRFTPWRAWWCRARHHLVFGGACLALWAKHRRAFRAAGFGFQEYWARCWLDMRRVLRQSDPRLYDFQTVEHDEEVAVA